MDALKSASLYFVRNKGQSVLLVILMAAIFWGELIGLFLYDTGIHAKEDAYRYNGSALYITGEHLNLSASDYERIENLAHVTGVSNWTEILVTPVGTSNVKEHTGSDPKETSEDTRHVGDDMVLLAQMDIPMYRLFRWEKAVSLIEGVFPDTNTQGVLVESRYAGLNSLGIGDEVELYAKNYDVTITVPICGIYEVDSEFEILEANEEGESVYIHSPYNTIFIDYYNALSLIPFESYAYNGCEIYVDDIQNLQTVGNEIHENFGQDVMVYDNTTYYLEDECQIVVLMNRLSQLICVLVFVIGQIIILITISMFADQYQKETAMYLILGERKRFCIGRFSAITGLYILSGMVVSVFIYIISAPLICRIVNDISIHVITNAQSFGIGGYKNTAIGQGFAVTVASNVIWNRWNALIMCAVGGATWGIALILPLYSVGVTRPRKLLE